MQKKRQFFSELAFFHAFQQPDASRFTVLIHTLSAVKSAPISYNE
jgi:hypothetical protein